MTPAKGDFRYHLLSIGVNRDANGSSVRAAERDAFGMSWTFAQLGYWRAERNRCLTGAQASAAAIDAHLGFIAGLTDLDLLLVYWSGYVFGVDRLVASLAAAGTRQRVLIVDTCHPGTRTLDLLDAFNRAADEAVSRVGQEPLFTTNGAGRLRIPILTQTPLP